MQKPMGEHVPAFRIGAQLNFVDGKKFGFAIERHRFDRAAK